MQTTISSSLWFKLVGAFAAVTLLTLAVTLAIFYALTQGELTRYLEQNSSSIEQILSDPQILNPVQVEAANTAPGPEPIIAITVPLENALQESTASRSAQFLGNIRRAVALAVGFAAILILAAGTLLFRQITQPLTRLKAAALALGAGERKVRVPVTTHDEVGQVGSAFNQMAEELEGQEKLRRQMIADIAHELRTPLSVIQSNLEAMIDGLITPDAGELSEVHGEVLRLTRLTADLRTLSLADAGQLQLRVSQVDVGDLIESILRQMTPEAQAKDISLEGDIQGIATTFTGDGDKLKQALLNLVVNSLQYTPAGGQISIRARESQEEFTITVADDGPGIPFHDQPHVFERFWRGDQSRSRSSGGSGLGLAISKEIVQLQGGTISLNSPPEGGCTFTISLPLNR